MGQDVWWRERSDDDRTGRIVDAKKNKARLVAHLVNGHEAVEVAPLARLYHLLAAEALAALARRLPARFAEGRGGQKGEGVSLQDGGRGEAVFSSQWSEFRVEVERCVRRKWHGLES